MEAKATTEIGGPSPSLISSATTGSPVVVTPAAVGSDNGNATNPEDTETEGVGEPRHRHRLWYTTKTGEISWLYLCNIGLGIMHIIVPLPCMLITLLLFYIGEPSQEVKEELKFRCFPDGLHTQGLLELVCFSSVWCGYIAAKLSFALHRKRAIGAGVPFDESYLLRFLQHNIVGLGIHSVMMISYVIYILDGDFFKSSFKMTFHIIPSIDRERENFIRSRQTAYRSYLSVLLLLGILSLLSQLMFGTVIFFYRRDVLPYKGLELAPCPTVDEPSNPGVEQILRTTTPGTLIIVGAALPGSDAQRSGVLSTITVAEELETGSPNNTTTSEPGQPFYVKFIEWVFLIHSHFGAYPFYLGFILVFLRLLSISNNDELEITSDMNGGNTAIFFVSEGLAVVWSLISITGIYLSRHLLISVIPDPNCRSISKGNRRLCLLKSLLITNIATIVTVSALVVLIIAILSGDLFTNPKIKDLPFTKEEAEIKYKNSTKLVDEWKRNQTIIHVRNTYSSAFTSQLIFGVLTLSYIVAFTVMVGYYRSYVKKIAPAPAPASTPETELEVGFPAVWEQ